MWAETPTPAPGSQVPDAALPTSHPQGAEVKSRRGTPGLCCRLLTWAHPRRRCFLSPSWVSAVPITAPTVPKPHTPREGRPTHTEGRPASCNRLPPALGFSGAVRKGPGVTDAGSLKGRPASSNPRFPKPPQNWCCDYLCCIQLPGFVQITKNDH